MKPPRYFLTILPKEQYVKIFPRLKEKRTQEFIVVILTLVSLTLFSLLAINPTISTIVKLRKQKADNEVILDDLTKKADNLLSLQQEFDSMPEDVASVFAAIPKSPQSPLLAAQLQALATQTNVKLAKIQMNQVEFFSSSALKNPGISESLAVYPYFSFNVSVQGSYQQIQAFLDAISKFDRIVTLDALSLTNSVQAASGSAPLSTSIRAKAYFQNF